VSARLRSDFWVAAYIRRCFVENAPAVLRRRGADEAGAILIKVDRLDGTSALYGPAPQSEVEERGSPRSFVRLHDAESIPDADAERRLTRQIDFDPDVWIVDVEDRAGRSFLD
jgi:hypothetical protein